MSNLKDLKIRIGTVKSTKKITKAMQMVAASKLRRAKLRAENARPYSDRMYRMLVSLAATMKDSASAPKLLVGNETNHTHLMIVATSDRGLCGGFNSSIAKAARQKLTELSKAGKDVKVICAGKKGYNLLCHTEFSRKILQHFPSSAGKQVHYSDASSLAETIIRLFEEEQFDSCSIVFNTFHSAISQKVTFKQLIPLELPTSELEKHDADESLYEYEPNEEAIIQQLLPQNIATQIYRALLENAAGVQGARMVAMDNATRNADEMIKKLTLQYNRSRQAAITKELIEIISGAEAL